MQKLQKRNIKSEFERRNNLRFERVPVPALPVFEALPVSRYSIPRRTYNHVFQ